MHALTTAWMCPRGRAIITSYDFAEQPENAPEPREDGTLVQRFD
ncbi:uncharacterized protein NP_4618A [Natronomonas pharaonis DSM 2160]|uniref:Uncharacterized protein n=1 Tax=Natronomonas pharaonis (strain ATCC 35678 / DSM 2160 / CIP 103997 / JCM 8858 / NBRC 14720 / NCIMB 2260 / Gabara) TaxID=348780 RepID=A0A1U7EYT5_NATPD|nr:hypothetical protein [Natronomonas pharaonis]CAI50400.1 uncharacterized protein NP_4618A [Natronomonas pharaonis DSM 2160]